MRLSVLNAIVWRIVAEIFRRHAHQHSLYLLESHPGASLRGRLHVRRGTYPAASETDPEIIFNLGGPAGTFEIVQPGNFEGPRQDFVVPMLEGDPIELLDRIDRGLGLHTPTALPKSTPGTLAVRLVAEVMAHESLARIPLRATMGWFDHNGYEGPLPWTKVVRPDAQVHSQDQSAPSLKAAFNDVGHLLAIHAAPHDEMLTDPDNQRYAIVDVRKGELNLAQSAKVGSSIDLMQAYQSNGRRLGSIVDRILSHLNR